MSKNSLVLVTGVSGYLGAHVVDRLAKEGYRVRGTVRSAKLTANHKAFSTYGDVVEIFAWDDLIKGQYPEAFIGVDAVIHLAAPLVGKEATAEAAIDVSVEGSLNILSQAEKAGIKNFAYASSIITFGDGFMKGEGRLLSDDDWLRLTKEQVVNNPDADGFTIYSAEKVLSERAVWDWADQHPHVELFSLNPSFFYGPFAPAHKSPYQGEAFSISSISTMQLVWKFIQPDGGNAPIYFVDVRDVARALVAALRAPPASKVGRKRVLICSPLVQPSELVDLITEERPAVAHRISEAIKATPDNVKLVVDNMRLKEVLDMEPLPWKKTILDSIDTLLSLEQEWKARGKPIYN